MFAFSSLRIAAVQRAFQVVVAVFGSIDTFSSLAVTVVCRAQVIIVTVLLFMVACASIVGIAPVSSARVVIITGLAGSRLAVSV
jgi:hypothetical protein